MIPRDLTQTDLDYYRDLNPRPVIYEADNEHVDPVQAIVTEVDDAGFARQVRVPWVLDEIDLVNLAKGGTLWLTCLGELPAHYLHVQPPHSAGASG
jgi:hypothetical protein